MKFLHVNTTEETMDDLAAVVLGEGAAGPLDVSDVDVLVLVGVGFGTGVEAVALQLTTAARLRTTATITDSESASLPALCQAI